MNLTRGVTMDKPSPVTQLSQGEYLVDRSDQSLPAFRRDPRATRLAIERWAAKLGIDHQDLVAAGLSAHSEPVQPPPRRSLLELVLTTLDSKDLARLSLPLDIIDKLRRTHL